MAARTVMTAREEVMAGLVGWTRYAVTHRAKVVKLDEPRIYHYSEDGKSTICWSLAMSGEHWRPGKNGQECGLCCYRIERRIAALVEMDLPITLAQETGLEVRREKNWLLGYYPNGGLLIRARTAEQFRAAAAQLLPMLPKEA